MLSFRKPIDMAYETSVVIPVYYVLLLVDG